MLFANWKKPVKLTTAAVLLFPLCAQAGIRRGHRDPGAAVWHCVYLTSWVRHSVCRVSVCQIPQVRHCWATRHRGCRPFLLLWQEPSSPGSAFLQKPTEVLSSPSNCSRTPEGSCAARFPFHPGFGSICWGIPPNSKWEQKWCWCNFSALSNHWQPAQPSLQVKTGNCALGPCYLYPNTMLFSCTALSSQL